MCIVYVICAESTGTFYTGQTSNLLKRLAQHNDPTSYSSGFRKRVSGPWVLVHQEDCATRSEAFRRERGFKTGRGRDFLRILVPVFVEVLAQRHLPPGLPFQRRH
jgi:putative endonuclease